MAKLAYRPFGLVLGILASMVAGAVFKQLWTRAAGKEDAPKARQSTHGWKELLAAAMLQGAIFGLVKAAADRGGARAFEKVTGTWPGD
jgi:Protein of unknown function (DUF4235)